MTHTPLIKLLWNESNCWNLNRCSKFWTLTTCRGMLCRLKCNVCAIVLTRTIRLRWVSATLTSLRRLLVGAKIRSDYYSSQRRSTTTSSTCCGIVFTGFASHSASSSSCVCWRSRRSMVWHRRISPISAGQLHQSAADRGFDLPLAATSWSAPPPRTSAPAHSLWLAQRHGTSCRHIYGH